MFGFLPEDQYELGQCGRPSTEVDHMGDPNDHSYEHLRGLCHDHHQVRTGRQGAAGKTRVMLTRKRPKDKHPGFK
jgi:5-methylcytosine-specific restriction enzyme A